MTRAQLKVVQLFLVFALAGHSCAAQEPGLAGFSDYVHEALRQWQVPGAAVVGIKDGEVIVSQGFGVRTIGETGDSAKVDERTMFAIASNTKSMTAILLAMLADQGRIRWDDRVIQHLPELQMFDPFVTRELTVRDLLCHRNGLPDFGGDIAWWGSSYDRGEVLRRVRFVRPVSSFRSRWAYQNTMFIAAGEIAAKASEETWDALMQTHLFQPLGMLDSTTSIKPLASRSNVATPHMRIGDRVQPIAWRNLDNGGPAASVVSNAKDMAAWLRFLVKGAKIDGKALISPRSLQELWSPQMVMPVSDQDRNLYGTHFRAYGLGWMIRDYHGMKVLFHGGWADGMLSFTAIVPERNAAAAVLTNLHNRDLSVPLGYRLLDDCLGRTPKDWCHDLLKTTIEEEAQQKITAKKLQADRHLQTRPSLPIADYTGKYASDLYGAVEVENRDNQLRLKLLASPTFTANLTHWHYDTFLATWTDPVAETSLVTFSLNPEGRATEMRFRMSDFIDPTVYTYRRVNP